jgi:hypothetical protein
MTTSNAAIRTVQIGTQTGVTDTPGALTFLEFIGEPVYPDLDPGKVRKQVHRRDGEASSCAQGEESGALSLTTWLRGKGAGAGNGATAVGGECDALFDAYFGMSGQHGVGITSGSSNAVDSIKMASTANFFDGSGSEIASAYMVQTSLGYQAREVASKEANTSITPHIDHTGTIANTAAVYAASSWIPLFTDNDHPFIYALVEGDTWARELFGCALQLSLVIPSKGHCSLQWGLQANHWASAVVAETAFSAESAAEPIFSSNSPFWFDDVATELIDGQIDFGWLVEARDATAGTNGQNGWIYVPSPDGPRFSGRMYLSETDWAEMVTAGTTHDLTLQIGASPGDAALIRVPAFETMKAPVSKYKGGDIVSFEGACTRPAAGQGSIHFHLFASAS